MNYRTAVLLATKTLGSSGTEIIDINVKDPISALRFVARWTSYASGEYLTTILDAFSKIELVDGSDVLMSLTGTEMAALHYYEGNPFIYVEAGNLFSNTSEMHLQINFGRFLRDPLLALDPARFRNPQLRITYNRVTPQVLASALTLEVTAELFDEKIISPMGFLRSVQFHSYSPTATTYEYIDLPTDLPIRKLYLQTREFGSAAANLLTDVKLSEDNDKRIPFDMTDTNWVNLLAMRYPPLYQSFWANTRGSTAYVYCAPCKGETVAALNTTDDVGVRVVGMSGGVFTFAADVTTDIIEGILRGFLPYFVYCYPFGGEGDPDDWYDVTKVGSLRLRVQSGSASVGATNNTILQQLRKYLR